MRVLFAVAAIVGLVVGLIAWQATVVVGQPELPVTARILDNTEIRLTEAGEAAVERVITYRGALVRQLNSSGVQALEGRATERMEAAGGTNVSAALRPRGADEFALELRYRLAAGQAPAADEAHQFSVSQSDPLITPPDLTALDSVTVDRRLRLETDGHVLSRPFFRRFSTEDGTFALTEKLLRPRWNSLSYQTELEASGPSLESLLLPGQPLVVEWDPSYAPGPWGWLAVAVLGVVVLASLRAAFPVRRSEIARAIAGRHRVWPFVLVLGAGVLLATVIAIAAPVLSGRALMALQQFWFGLPGTDGAFGIDQAALTGMALGLAILLALGVVGLLFYGAWGRYYCAALTVVLYLVTFGAVLFWVPGPEITDGQRALSMAVATPLLFLFARMFQTLLVEASTTARIRAMAAGALA